MCIRKDIFSKIKTHIHTAPIYTEWLNDSTDKLNTPPHTHTNIHWMDNSTDTKEEITSSYGLNHIY